MNPLKIRNLTFSRKSGKLFLFLTGFLALIVIFSQELNGGELNQVRLLFQQANTDYSEEKFEEAGMNYEKALSLGFESGALYYNLGSAYFKTGCLGKAILNYLRAEKLMPEDPDLKSNLDYARSLIKSGRALPSRNWIINVFLNFSKAFSLDRITLIVSILYFGLFILVMCIIKAKKSRKILIYISAVILILLMLAGSVFSCRFYKTFIQREAVIVVKTADSKFEPFAEGTTFFVLNEGEVVSVVQSKKEWIKIRRLDGKQGWIKKEDIAYL